MPSSTPERQSRWPGGDNEACSFLEQEGFKLTAGWCWTHPSKELDDLTEREEDAIIYMIEEWDYGGFISASEGGKPR